MSDVNETPDIAFRRLYREDWAKFLNSSMGKSLISALYSRKPLALPSKYKYTLGKVFQFDFFMNFIASELTRNIEIENKEVPQNYPPEGESKNTESVTIH